MRNQNNTGKSKSNKRNQINYRCNSGSGIYIVEAFYGSRSSSESRVCHTLCGRLALTRLEKNRISTRRLQTVGLETLETRQKLLLR